MHKPIEKNSVHNSKTDADKKAVKHHKDMPEFSSVDFPETQKAPVCNDSETPVNTRVYGPQAANSALKKS